MQPVQRKAIIVLMLVLALALVWLRPIDATAQQYIDAGFKRALVTFASARALNALISLAQGATVSVQVGAGASIQPGAVLDPLDDLVEQFSMIMLVATLSFATQHLLIALFGAWPISILLSVGLTMWCAFLWRAHAAPSWLARTTTGLLLLSLAVPVTSVGSEITYRLFLARDYEAAQSQIKTSPTSDAEPVQNESYVETLKRIWAQSTDIGKQVDQLKSKASGLVEHLVRLAAVFIVQTILLPLFFLWGMLQLYRMWVFRRSTNELLNRSRRIGSAPNRES